MWCSPCLMTTMGCQAENPSPPAPWLHDTTQLCIYVMCSSVLATTWDYFKILLLEIGILCRRIKMNVKPTFVSRPAPTQFPWVRFLERRLVDFLAILTRVYKVTVVGWTHKTTQLRGRGCVGGRCQVLCLRIPLWFVYACSFAGEFWNMCKSTTILSHMCDPLQDVIKTWWPFLHALQCKYMHIQMAITLHIKCTMSRVFTTEWQLESRSKGFEYTNTVIKRNRMLFENFIPAPIEWTSELPIIKQVCDSP